MATSLNKTKHRISSIKSTQKITKAMELVASVKLKRYRKILDNNALYTQEMTNIANLLFMQLDNKDDQPYLNMNKDKKTLYVVINSTLGLCASFNNDVYSFVEKNIDKENSTLLLVGLKGDTHYSKLGYEVDKNYISLNDKLTYADIVKLSTYLNSAFLEKKYSSIKIVYTKFVNSLKYVPSLTTIFPLNADIENKGYEYPPIFDPDVESLIQEIVPIYATTLLYQRIIESSVSEQSARRNAMENANDNADELLDELIIEYNKARQAQITQEISEIVSATL